MSNNKYPYESEFWVFFVKFLSPPRRVFYVCSFSMINILLCTTLCIWTVFNSQQFFLLKEKRRSVLSD